MFIFYLRCIIDCFLYTYFHNNNSNALTQKNESTAYNFQIRFVGYFPSKILVFKNTTFLHLFVHLSSFSNFVGKTPKQQFVKTDF